MRTENSIKNSITSVILRLIIMLTGFITQSIFIKTLGVEFLGLNGLFSNILSMLNIFELGVGSAIIYNLYRPIAENNTDEIKSLMMFYKKTYYRIVFVIGTVGLALLPFLKYIIGSSVNTLNINIYISYLLVLLNTLSTYIISYKRSIILAYQKNYILNIIHTIYILVLNILQILQLLFISNYYLYLVTNILCQLIENLIISLVADKKYPLIKEKDVKKIDNFIENNIFTKVKALIFHKFGAAIVLATDNIIISKFLGVAIVGLYSNYSMIINSVNSLFAEIIASTTSSIGNLLVSDDKSKNYQVFLRLFFLNFWFATFAGICLLLLIQPFIEMWVGSKFLIQFSVVLILNLNFFQNLLRRTFESFKDAGGIWVEDRHIPIIEAITNIFFSIFLLHIFGLAGVFMGTICSSLVLWFYSYPKNIYIKLFGRNFTQYFLLVGRYFASYFLICILSLMITKFISFDNVLLQFIFNGVVAIFFSNFCVILLNKRTAEYDFTRELLKSILTKKIKNIN